MIEVEGLGKRFGERAALSDLSLAVHPGEMVALVGPDGAGKTTTLRLLLGLLTPDAGTIRVAGLDPRSAPGEVRERVGYLGQASGFYRRLDPCQNLRFFGRLHRLEETHLDERIEALLRSLDLWEQRGDKVGSFSPGMERRLGLGRALLHDPEVLLVDEPARSLDPEAAAGLGARLEALREKGKTLLVATRDIGDGARLGSRVAILKTRLLACDTPEQLRRGSGPRRMALHVSRLGGDELRLLQTLPFVKGFELSAGTIRAAVADPDRDIPVLVGKLATIGCQVKEVHDDDAPLEEVYRGLVEQPGETPGGSMGEAP